MSREDNNHPADDTAPSPGLAGVHVQQTFVRLIAEPLAPGLYLVATPIGNLGDISLRALSILARADVILCEDTRHSAKLLQHYGIRAATRAFHEHNEEGEIPSLVRDLERGRRIAVISDAGTPLVSDPGFKLVRAASERGIALVSVPGANAAITALAASGLPTDAFFFAGFLPSKQGARLARLHELKLIPGTLLFYESPQRLADTLKDMAEALGNRAAVVARELTKLHEECVRGSLEDLAARYAVQDVKGEIVILCAPAAAAEVSDEDIAARLAVALTSMRLKEAVAAVADALGVSKSRVYGIGLKVKDEAP